MNGIATSLYLTHSTPDFSVWAKIFMYPLRYPTYLGNSDTLSVTVNIPTPPLSAYISGDDEVGPYEDCSWQAFASGGTPPYSYSWWGGLSGSTQTIDGALSQSSYLYVAVTDAASQADTTQMFVEVDGSYECDE